MQHETLTREAEHKTQIWEWVLMGYLVMFHLNLNNNNNDQNVHLHG